VAIAYFDCFAGAGGDMIVASLLDAGADLDAVGTALAGLAADGYALRSETVVRGGIAGTRFVVDLAPDAPQPARHLAEILAMIDSADLPGRAAERASAIFTRLAEAEAKVHRVPVEQVHFHEVGAVDSIVDIVAACVALELLAIDRVVCSAIPTGGGTVDCDHGRLPVPSPATAELLIGAPAAAGEQADGEVTTPTAAAVLTTLAEAYGGPPEMTVRAVGYGAGTRESGPLPNLLRVLIGEPAELGQVDTLVELAANIDDCTGEVIGATIEKLLAAGCVDAWAQPIFMKKSRPAWMLCALCGEADTGACERILFAETTTFGVRRRRCVRSKLARSHETVETPYGPIRMKLGRLGDETVTASPEYGDCLAAAETHHVALREVMLAAQEVFRQRGRL